MKTYETVALDHKSRMPEYAAGLKEYENMTGIKEKKRFKFKKVFSLMLISYVIMLFIPIILSGYLIYMVNNLTTARYRENISANLEQSCLLLEQRLDAMDKNARVLTNHSLLLQVVRFSKPQPGDQNVLQIREFQKYLKTLFPEDMNQYAVILKNGYAFTSSGVTYGREFFFNATRNYENMGAEEWINRSFFEKGRTLFPFQKINQGTNTRQAITYNMPVGSYYMPDEADGCVQFFIDDSFLKDIFQPILRLQGCYVVLYSDNDGKNEPVLKLTNDEAKEPVGEITDYEELKLTDMSGYKTVVDRQKDNIGEIVYDRSDNGKFTAVVYIPHELVLDETRQLRITLFGLVCVSLLIEIGLGLYFSFRYSTPIKNLIHNIHTILQPGGNVLSEDLKKGPGEYDQLESGINLIIQKNNELKSELVKKETREISDFYKKLLMGIFNHEEDALYQMNEMGLSMEAKGYCAAVFEAKDQAQRVRDFLCSVQIPMVHRIQIMDGGFAALLFCVEEDQEMRLLEVAASLAEQARAVAGRTLPFGMGRIYQHLTDITFSYNQAVYCAGIANERNVAEVVRYDDVAQNLNILYYPADLEERLINSTRHGDSEQIESIFGLLREENVRKRHLPPAMERLLESNIMAALLKVYSDTVPGNKIDSLISGRHEVMDIEEMLANQKQMFLEVCSEFMRSRSDKQEDTRKQFLSFIESNYRDCQLSVKTASDLFDFSESYFSIIFKESVGESFSTCLERVRMSHAKQLLEGGLGVETVSECVGYNNSGTFRRAFKRANGISPTEWKDK